MIERSQKLVGIKDKKIVSKYISKHISTEKYTNVHLEIEENAGSA